MSLYEAIKSLKKQNRTVNLQGLTQLTGMCCARIQREAYKLYKDGFIKLIGYPKTDDA